MKGQMLRAALLGACLCAGFQAHAGEAWRWKENGRWVYGDKYPKGAFNPERVLALDTRGATEPQSSGNEKAAKLFPVVLYGVGCPGCEAAKTALEARGVPVTVKDPSKPEVYEEFKKRSPQSLAPVILVGDKSLVGFDEAALAGALDDAGYDKASVKAAGKPTDAPNKPASPLPGA
jgi:glutaredoxin 3